MESCLIWKVSKNGKTVKRSILSKFKLFIICIRFSPRFSEAGVICLSHFDCDLAFALDLRYRYSDLFSKGFSWHCLVWSLILFRIPYAIAMLPSSIEIVMIPLILDMIHSLPCDMNIRILWYFEGSFDIIIECEKLFLTISW